MAKSEKPKQTKRTEIKDLPVTEKELTREEAGKLKGGKAKTTPTSDPAMARKTLDDIERAPDRPGGGSQA